MFSSLCDGVPPVLDPEADIQARLMTAFDRTLIAQFRSPPSFYLLSQRTNKNTRAQQTFLLLARPRANRQSLASSFWVSSIVRGSPNR
jgi:hypothetical protein